MDDLADFYGDCGHPLPPYPVVSETTDKSYCCTYCRDWFEPAIRPDDTSGTPEATEATSTSLDAQAAAQDAQAKEVPSGAPGRTHTISIDASRGWKLGGPNGNRFVQGDTERHAARCSCGWISTLSSINVKTAQADGRRHLREAAKGWWD